MPRGLAACQVGGNRLIRHSAQTSSMPHPDDARLAAASRLLRRKAGLTQRDIQGPGRSRRFVLELEAGDAGRLDVGDIRDHFTTLGASVRVSVWWNGAALDRVLDERHAGVVERAVSVLRGLGWQTQAEVTFSEFGERGSIDLLGHREELSAIVVGEAKSAWGSVEETNRTLDVKARLAPKICFDRLGWRPRLVAKVLIFPDDGAARRIAAKYSRTLDSVYPARSRDVRRWLRTPEGQLSGLWFLSNVTAA